MHSFSISRYLAQVQCQDFFRSKIKHLSIDVSLLQIVSEYAQELQQSQTANKPMATRGRATQQSRDTRETN